MLMSGLTFRNKKLYSGGDEDSEWLKAMEDLVISNGVEMKVNCNSLKVILRKSNIPSSPYECHSSLSTTPNSTHFLFLSDLVCAEHRRLPVPTKIEEGGSVRPQTAARTIS